MEKDCLLYDIQAHVGSVYDCSWSGDSRLLLSVGTDGRARLWDAAAGSELCQVCGDLCGRVRGGGCAGICKAAIYISDPLPPSCMCVCAQANFEHGFGVVDSGGFVKCDLASDGHTMAGCTAKGHLIQWDIGLELRKGPNGQMLYQWLASMPNASARSVYAKLMEHYPLMYNVQDSRGWTVLMHAAEDSNAEIIKLIVGEFVVAASAYCLHRLPCKLVPPRAALPAVHAGCSPLQSVLKVAPPALHQTTSAPIKARWASWCPP